MTIVMTMMPTMIITKKVAINDALLPRPPVVIFDFINLL